MQKKIILTGFIFFNQNINYFRFLTLSLIFIKCISYDRRITPFRCQICNLLILNTIFKHSCRKSLLPLLAVGAGWLDVLEKNRSSPVPSPSRSSVSAGGAALDGGANRSFSKSLLLAELFKPVSVVMPGWEVSAGGEGSEFRPSRSSVSGWGSGGVVVKSASKSGSLVSRDRVPSMGAEYDTDSSSEPPLKSSWSSNWLSEWSICCPPSVNTRQYSTTNKCLNHNKGKKRIALFGRCHKRMIMVRKRIV